MPDDDAVVLAWPETETVCHLESAEGLDAADWTTDIPVLNETVADGLIQVTVEFQGTVRFFRLRGF